MFDSINLKKYREEHNIIELDEYIEMKNRMFWVFWILAMTGGYWVCELIHQLI